ncbi:MAG TPA: von Willebrand factor type A domain-containing protein, partial [Polyangiaceae bacterium]
MRRSACFALLFLGPVASMACGGSYAAREPGAPYPMTATATRSMMATDESMPAPAPMSGAPISVAKTAEQDGTEQYTDYGVNPVTDASRDHLSTFAIDVDTASYSIARRFLRQGSVPPPQAVRAEEFLNSFVYDYAPPKDGAFTVHMNAAPSPFEQGHYLLRVALQGKTISAAERKPVHLVYLVDTSGSMQGPDRIDLAKKSLRMLTDTLKPGDTVALCTYAGSVRLVLEPTGIDKKTKILAAIEDLTAGGSTAMASGIELAYRLASQTAVAGQVNRVVVLSDGDANVGNTSHEDILKTIAQYKDRGITLSTVGFGSGNYKDTMMEQLADKGD